MLGIKILLAFGLGLVLGVILAHRFDDYLFPER